MNTKQLELFSGESLKDAGMKIAVDYADYKIENWSELAYEYLLFYINTHYEFMAEEVRESSAGYVPAPPSARAWGAILVRAKNEKRIRANGYRSVKNAKAHSTPATVWVKIN